MGAASDLDANTLATLGDVLVALGDVTQAYATYDAALTLEPENSAALAGVSLLQMSNPPPFIYFQF